MAWVKVNIVNSAMPPTVVGSAVFNTDWIVNLTDETIGGNEYVTISYSQGGSAGSMRVAGSTVDFAKAAGVVIRDM